jgi:hypothetical protein
MKPRVVVQLLVTFVAAACAAVPPRGQRDWLDFLQPGATTRSVVADRLGTPDADFEGGRILTYWVAADAGGYYKPRQHDLRTHSLVLVFRRDDVLDRHSLVKVRGE